MQVLEHLAALSQPATRVTAANRIAALFGAAHFLLFIYDDEIEGLLPAPGFIQTLPDGRLWQPFLKSCLQQPQQAFLPYPAKGEFHTCYGYPISNGSVAVFIGAPAGDEACKPLFLVLPVITDVLQLEHKRMVDLTLKELAQKTTEKAEKLAHALDIVRHNLQVSLNQEERANREIRELMNKKDEFMNMASHELKTPITSVKAYLQIITQNLPLSAQNQPLYSLIEKALKQTERLAQLVNDLLDVNKIQSGQLKLNKSTFNMLEVVADCIEQEQIQTSSHQIVLTADNEINIHGDKARIEQVITNLISNAVKYSPEANTVHVEASLNEHNECAVRVTDYGIGIPEDAFPNLFDRFYRVDSSAHNFAGLGLGLYISAEIIQRHNGKIGLQSKEGKGSSFWFTLPLQ